MSRETVRGDPNVHCDRNFSFGDGNGSRTHDNQSSSSSNLSSPSMTNKSVNKGKEAESIRLPPLPTVPQFRSWKLALRDEVAGASGQPDLGYRWICEVDQSSCTIESLADSGTFPSLDAKLAAALAKITTGELSRQINVHKERFAAKSTFMKVRQVLWEIYRHYQIGVTEGSLLNMQDLMDVRLNNDNLQAFLNDWESVLAVMSPLPHEDVLHKPCSDCSCPTAPT